MAGRTGAAYAAQLGTMNVTQEIDAFTTMGFSLLEFLVLTRMIALILMMPLLVLYADFVGTQVGCRRASILGDTPRFPIDPRPFCSHRVRRGVERQCSSQT